MPYIEREKIFEGVTDEDTEGLWGHYEVACRECGRPIQIVIPVAPVIRGDVDINDHTCFGCEVQQNPN